MQFAMGRKCLLALVASAAIIAGACASAGAALVTTTRTMASLLDPDSSQLIGDKLYSHFTYDSTGDAPVDPEDVHVTFTTNDGSHYNVRFSFALDAFPGERTDVLICYQIDVTSSDYIHAVGLDFNGNVPLPGTGPAAATVTETVSSTDGSDVSPGAPIRDTELLSVYNDGINQQNSSSLPVNLTRSLEFCKDIIVSSRSNGGVATISFVDNSVDQTPEPTSLALLAFGGVPLLLRRNRIA